MDWTLEVVHLPVSDVDASIAFYRDKAGFELDFDTRTDDMHFAQLTPRGSGCSIVVGDLPSQREMAPGSMRRLQLVVADAQVARQELLERGVDASEMEVIDPRDGGTLFAFSDPDGNTWSVQQMTVRGERPLIPAADEAAYEILLAGARALARVDGLESSLQLMLDAIGEHCDVESAVVVAGPGGALEIVATFGLDDAAIGGLTGAIGRPTHPIARTFNDPTPTFDVLPTVPGGPALRSHLPLIVTRGGTDRVVGVLALAHEPPIDTTKRPIIQAAADLTAAAIERHRQG
jgi:predicted enzyme related to lactoylglutathione lyase